MSVKHALLGILAEADIKWLSLCESKIRAAIGKNKS